ncbi:hypothetical protein [Acidisoma sp. L85]|uniref:hypothetical protein n=1 Tax=Acidisoma sp. L85 TaxID=1641850 RepID=UPI00131A622C|nr:hypothetical protein [Acidisoma sp. L85]
MFVNLKALLESARSIATARPDLRLVLTVPADALKSDRDWVRQIADRVNPALEDAGTKRMSIRMLKRVRRAVTENALCDMHSAIPMTAAR